MAILDKIASHPVWCLLVAVCLVLVLYPHRGRDYREPPVIRPRIPFIGHALGLARWQNEYLWRIYKQRPRPVATLPMPAGKIYVIWDPHMIQSAMRNRNLDFGRFALSSARDMLGLDPHTFRAIATNKRIVAGTTDVTHTALAGTNLARTNVRAIDYLVGHLCATCPGGYVLNVPNVYMWMRNLVTMATLEALFGDENPWAKDPSLMEDLWTLESSLYLLVLGVPRTFARRVYDARDRLHAALTPYYRDRLYAHPSAAAVTRERADILHQEGIPPHGIAQLELAIAVFSTSNTVPSMYWLLTHVFSRPELAKRLRAEAETAMQVRREGDGSRPLAVVKIADIEASCPLLVSCYRETIRLTSRVVGHRQVRQDMMMADSSGAEYLLKAGATVQLAATATHRMEDVWGPDALEFRPDRFLSEGDKSKRDAYVPFGGGRHLCPGRHLAFAEHLGLLVTLLVGFEVTGQNGETLSTIGAQTPKIGVAIVKPLDAGAGQGVRIVRRKGWESVQWRFLAGERV